MSDIVSEIKTRCAPERFDLATAEGRGAWDDALRCEIAAIDSPSVRRNAAEMIKAWRRAEISAFDQRGRHD